MHNLLLLAVLSLYGEEISKAEQRYRIPRRLLLSVCRIESGLDVLAYSYLDGKGDRNHSFGICQVTYETAKIVGWKEDTRCREDFRAANGRGYSSCSLFGLKTNLNLAAKYLSMQLNRYRENTRKAVSAYNAGTYTVKNRKYVDKIMEVWSATTKPQ